MVRKLFCDPSGTSGVAIEPVDGGRQFRLVTIFLLTPHSISIELATGLQNGMEDAIMARPAAVHPTDAELGVLRVLWESGPCTLGQVCSALREEKQVATTTIATVLQVMLQKKLVKRKQGKRGYLWSARLSRQTAASGLVRKLLDRVFDGSAHRLVAHLVEDGQLDDEELTLLRDLLKSHRSEDNSKE